MLYFKHQELVTDYHVSLKTVHNWIDAAKQGKLDLRLYEHSGRTYIVNDAGNVTMLKRLVEQGKKFRNTRYHKVASPTAAFYELYNRKQILDIISSLDIHREIPRQYNYFDGGANKWDDHTHRLWNEETSNLLKSTVELLHANLGSIDLLLEGRKRVNVIDIGPGNGLPVKELLGHLLERGVLNRYIAIDISESMLQIAKQNISDWFGDKIEFEGHIRDITYERFDDVIVDDMLAKGADETTNLVLLLGATPMNFRSPSDILRVVYGNLGHDDLLVYTDKPDSEAERRYFNLNTQPDGANALAPMHSFIFDLLNIDASLYDVEMAFNEQKRVRYIQVRLKVTLTIKFKFKDGERGVDLDKGDTIILWRVWHLSALEIVAEFEKAGFALLQSSLTKDRQYLLTIFGVNTKLGLGS